MMRILVMSAVFLISLLASSQSIASDFYLSCPSVTPDSANCLLSHESGKVISEVAVAIDGMGAQDHTYRQFSGGKDSVHFSFLVDVSDPSRKKAIAAARSIIEEIVNAADDKTNFALAEFSSNLNQLVAGPAQSQQILAGLKALKANGQATELFANSITAIESMENIDASRKILFLFSDGRFEDTAYSIEQVVEQAARAGVVIYAIGFPEAQSATPDLQSMRRLSDETSGLFWMAVPETFDLPSGYLATAFEHLNNGGFLSIQNDFSQKNEVKVTLTYEDGSSETASSILSLAAGDIKISTYSSIMSGYFEVTDAIAATLGLKRAVVSWVIGALVAGLAAFVIWLTARFGFKRSLSHKYPEGPDQDNIPEEETALPLPVLAILVYQTDGERAKKEISSRHFTIGRNSDCDFVVDANEDSVSRDHAHIHFNKDDEFVLVDLDSMNGVFVSDSSYLQNKQKIGQHKLTDQDIFWLGDFEIQFVLPNRR